MRIYPVVFAFNEDIDLIWLQRQFIKKIGAPVENHTLFVERSFSVPAIVSEFLEREGIRLMVRKDGFFPWPSRAHCRCKTDAYRAFIGEVKPSDEDYILDMDDDAFLVGTKILEHLGKADLTGFRFTNRLTWVHPLARPWANIMGSFMAMRVSAMRRMLDLSERHLVWAEEWLSSTHPFGLVHDMYVPLLMELSGASSHCPDSGNVYCEGKESEAVLLRGNTGHSVAHLYGEWDTFAGFKIRNKYEIPRIMRKLGLP